MSLLQRISDIPLRNPDESQDKLAAALYRNREALIPLIARYGMPGSEVLLPDDEEFFQGERKLPRQALLRLEKGQPLLSRVFQKRSGKRRNIREQLKELLNSEIGDYIRALFGDQVETDPEGVLKQLEERYSQRPESASEKGSEWFRESS